jgi:nucleoid-associated protein YgaU
MLPAITFAVGLVLAFMLRKPREVPPPPAPPLEARVRSALAAHAATRSLSLSVAETAGSVHVSGVVPSDLYIGLVRELASESADGHVDFQGLVAAPAEQPVSYQVRQGDSLWLIAKRKYGDADLWPEIEKTNRDHSIPVHMMVGDRLMLPVITIHPR